MANELTDDCVVRLPPGTIVRDFAGRMLLLPRTEANVVEVQEATAELLRACLRPVRFGALRLDLAWRAESEVFSTVAQLVARGWLELQPQTHAAGFAGESLDRSSSASDPGRWASSAADPGGLLGSIATRLPSPTDEERWLRLLAEQRLLPIAALACTGGPSEAFGDVALTAAVAARLDRMARDRVVWSMIVERSGLAAAEALANAGISCVVLKGLATAHLDYPDPSWRELGDVDLLVHPDEVLAADAALRAIAQPAEEVSARLRLRNKERVFVDPTGVEIDLHHRLIEDPFGFAVPLDELFAAREHVQVNGVALAALCPAHRLAHAVAHWASSIPDHRRASGLLDVVLLCRRPETVRAARQALASWSLGTLAADVPELLGSPEDDHSRVRGALFVRAHHGSRLAGELAAAFAQSTVRGGLRELGVRLFPSDELMALHGVSRTHRLARFAWRATVRGRHG